MYINFLKISEVRILIKTSIFANYFVVKNV